MKGKNNPGLWLLLLATIVALGACSGKQPVNFNIHTEPEGAHVIYSVDGMQWIYLGVTPLDAVQVLDEGELEGRGTFTLRAMRCGYLEQSKQWTVENLFRENKKRGQVFWTPRLIRSSE